MKPLLAPHIPTIPGLRHGGMAQAMRRRMTPFGSGWQGIDIGRLENAYEGRISDIAEQLKQAVDSKGWVPASTSDVGPMFADAQKLRATAREAMPFVDEGPIERIGAGAESTVFGLSPKHVLKASVDRWSPVASVSPEELKDVPEILQPIRVHEHGELTNRIYPRAIPYPNTAASMDKVLELRAGLEAKGWQWRDASVPNIGEVAGQAKIIDPGFIMHATKVPEFELPESLALARNVMKNGSGEAAASTSMSLSKKLFQGARRMVNHL